MQAISNKDALQYDQRINPISAAMTFAFTGGSGYTSAPTVAFSGGAGTGAAGTAVITNGRVTGITITNGGTGYTSAPTIAFTGGGGDGASATAVLTADAVTSATISSGGTGQTIVVTDNSDYGTDTRLGANITTADKFGNVKDYHIGDVNASNSVTMDLLADGFNPVNGIDMEAFVTSSSHKTKDGSAWDVGQCKTSGSFIMMK